jgi:ketosteroid isomerase-like protein
MEQWKKGTAVVAALSFILLLSPPLSAQEWSSEQKEVWKNVETYWGMWASRDLEGFMSYIHNDYSGWFHGSHLPSGKDASRKWIAHSFSKSKVLVHDIRPLAIKIHGNVAIVHYVYADISQDSEGKEKMEQGRWTDILMKQGDRWVLIGDHGGSMSD